jgi:hypothetical protein
MNTKTVRFADENEKRPESNANPNAREDETMRAENADGTGETAQTEVATKQAEGDEDDEIDKCQAARMAIFAISILCILVVGFVFLFSKKILNSFFRSK